MTEIEQFRQRLAAGALSRGPESLPGVADLSLDRRESSLERLARLITARGLDHEAEGRQLLIDAGSGLEAIATGGTVPLTNAMRVGIEAIIHADGSRPAIRVCNDSIDAHDPTLGVWKVKLLQEPVQLRKVLRAVARISLASANPEQPIRIIGTGFLTETGLLTNRHVLQLIAVQDDQVAGKWRFHEGVVIDFGAEHARTERMAPRARPVRVRKCGPDEIGRTSRPALLDLALIEVQADNPTIVLPGVLELELDNIDLPSRRNIFAIGFPAKPQPGTESNQILLRLFGDVFGVKRVSPGLVGQVAGQVIGDSDPPRCFSHDASTLGGSSGSCIVDLEGSWKVIGLHFGGRSGVRNLAHQLARAL